jgi:hypothetical protein
MPHPDNLAITPAMYALLNHYAKQGGALLISGSYLGEESRTNAVTEALLENILHAEERGYITDWSEQSITGLGTTLEIPRWINPEHYAVTRPEVFVPLGDGFTPLIYEHSHLSAAVAYSGLHRSILLGFPFEAIRSAYDRDLVMSSLLEFLTGE